MQPATCSCRLLSSNKDTTELKSLLQFHTLATFLQLAIRWDSRAGGEVRGTAENKSLHPESERINHKIHADWTVFK